jgi:8-oxo-dGTP pyrophosphatase MutT (NUDIX family)
MAFPRAFQTYIPRSHCITSHVYGAILLNNFHEIVVVKGRKSGKWSFPKGHGEYRELPLEACVRELKEETGIDMTGVTPDDEMRFRFGTYFVFYVEGRLPIVTQDANEIEAVMWVSLYRLNVLVGNKDVTSFCRTVNLQAFANKMVSR